MNKPFDGANAVVVTYGASGAGKCLAGDSEILLSDGSVRTIESIVTERAPVSVLAMGDDYKIRPATVTAYHRNGPRPVVRVTTVGGWSIDATLNHPLLGLNGWVEISSLKPGDRIAIALMWLSKRFLPFLVIEEDDGVEWDEIRSIEDMGTMETFDITVPGPHNFIANGVFVHNSVDQLYSFPQGLFVAPPGALKPAERVVGHVPAHVEAATIMDATKIVQEQAKHRGKYDAVVVDDFSLLAEATIAVLEKKHSGFKLWGAMRDVVLEFRDVARHAGLHVLMTAHESAPKTTNGLFVRGGPRLPGRLPEDLPTACDLVLRAAYDATRRGWHICYRCTVDDPQWVTKDRHGVTPDRAPMNTAEILRMAGYQIRRAPGCEWQEPIVDVLSKALIENPNDERALMEEAILMCREHTTNDLFVRWVMRDALDRAALVRAQANTLQLYLG